MLREEGNKSRILAVDEFAIHKGHSYATCVMDLEQGDILWVGKGRAMKDFEKFFEDMTSDSLSAVIGWTKWFQAAKESEFPALDGLQFKKKNGFPA